MDEDSITDFIRRCGFRLVSIERLHANHPNSFITYTFDYSLDAAIHPDSLNVRVLFSFVIRAKHKQIPNHSLITNPNNLFPHKKCK